MAMQTSVMRWDSSPPMLRREEGENPGAPRRGSASDVEVVLPGSGLQYPGQVVELSVQGCLIQTRCRLENGTAVEVWLRTEEMPLRLPARLVQKSERGVQFIFHPLPLALRKQVQIEELRAKLGMVGQRP